METTPLKLAVVGGGLGGLSLVLSLNKLIPDHRRYLHIDIYESTGSLKAQVGAGIGMWPFNWAILTELGLIEKLNKYTLFQQSDEPVAMLQVRKGDENPGRDLFRMTSTSGRIIVFHRGDFQAVFLDNLPDTVTIHTRKRLDTYTQDDNGVVLYFEDGTTAQADILVGADGLQSRVRRKLVEETGATSPSPQGLHPAEARWSGVLTYRALVPRNKLLEQGYTNHRGFHDWSVYVGKDAALMCYPVSNGANVNFVGFKNFPQFEGTQFREEVLEKILREEGYERPQSAEVKAAVAHENVADGDIWSENSTARTADGKRARWFTRVSPEEVKHVYRGWEDEAQALINGVESPICWAVHMVPKLKTFSHKRVCLLGDAAHAMRPQQGTGAGASISDSYLLAKLFASAIATDPTKLGSKIDVILGIYDEIRRPIGEDIAAAARACAFHFNTAVQEGTSENEIWAAVDTTTEEGIKKLQDHLTNGWSYAWDREMVPRSVKKAEESLQERY